MASFAQQYGIRLHREYDEISAQEYYQLLTRLNGDTPLGNLIRIRSENDFKKIQEMSKEEKEIRNKWSVFKMSQKSRLSDSEKKKQTEYFYQIVKSMFGGDNR